MKYTYEIIVDELTKDKTLKRTDENGAVDWVPMDEANAAYQRYLRWLENPEAEENGTIS
jgi:hypothetical protein